MQTVKSPQISVIIPAYKAADHLHVAVDSLLKQTMTDFEVIIVEDCSDDGGATLEAAQRYAKSDPRFRVLQTDYNCGCGMARNKGIKEARGEYILFLDADDYFHCDTLAGTLSIAKKHNAEIVCYNCCRIYPDGTKTEIITGAHETVYSDTAEIRDIALQSFYYYNLSKFPKFPGNVLAARMYKRSLLMDNNLHFAEEDHLMSEDALFAYQTMLNVKCCVYTPNTYYFYVQRPQSISRNINPDLLERVVKAANYFEKAVNDDPDTPENAIYYIWSYVLLGVRSCTKQMFMSDRSMAFKRHWMEEQAEMPIFRTIYENYPLYSLPLKHRLSFVNFYKKRFLPLYVMVVGQEKLRALLGKK